MTDSVTASADPIEAIAVAIQDIEELTAGMGPSDVANLVETDGLKFRAIKDALTDIGDAAEMLDVEMRDRHAVVDWNLLVGMKDAILDGSFKRDVALSWTLASAILPHLSTAVDEWKASQTLSFAR